MACRSRAAGRLRQVHRRREAEPPADDLEEMLAVHCPLVLSGGGPAATPGPRATTRSGESTSTVVGSAGGGPRARAGQVSDVRAAGSHLNVPNWPEGRSLTQKPSAEVWLNFLAG